MASFDDLGRALRDDAVANAPRASAIDVDAVTHAARARRRPRQWAVGTLSVVAVLGFGGLAVSAVTPPVLIAASESADLAEESVESDSAPLAEGGDEGQRVDGVEWWADGVACGASASTLETGESALSLDLRLPSSASSNGDTIDASAILLNSSTEPITLVTGASVVAVLTQSGSVVGVELERDTAALEVELEPGHSREVPMPISTLDCRGAGSEPLAAGTYGVIAVLAVLESATGERSLIVAPTAEILLD